MSTIKSIIKKSITNETLWNLAVEGDESYIANGVVVHNCRSVLIPITRFEEWSADGVTNSGSNVDKFLQENVGDKGFPIYQSEVEPKIVEHQITDPGVSFKTEINGLVEVITYSKSGKVFERVTTTRSDDLVKKILSIEHEKIIDEPKI